MSEFKELIVLTEYDATEYESKDLEDVHFDFLEYRKCYPKDQSELQIALGYAQDYDAGDHPMLFKGLELTVLILSVDEYENIDDRGFASHARRYIVKGELMPHYSVTKA